MNSRDLIKRFIKELVLESENDSVNLTANEYENLMKFLDYDGRRINKMKKYAGKQIFVNGSVKLSNTPTTYLGNITFDSSVDVSNSQFKTIEGASIPKYKLSYHNTPYHKWLLRQEFLKKRAEQESKRENNDLDPESNLTDIDKCALALFNHLIQTEYEEKTPEDIKRLEELYAEKERREEIEKETEDNENLLDLEVIEEEIKEIEDRIDVYDLHYEGTHYFLKTFKLLKHDGESRETWAVGTKYQTEKSAKESVEQLLDDIGLDGFNRSFVENHIDEEELKNYFRDGEYDNVRDNLDDFFSEDDYEYSDPKVQERIDEIEELLENSENLSQEEYDELNEELDDLKDSDKDISEDLIEEKVEELLDDLVSDPMNTIKNYGLELSSFVDMGALIKDIVDTDGYGQTLNHYDGNEDTIEYDDETYYIFQIDG
jgi:ElaB/YqjD/DUF883 family membrane-anchored ribosome-binding protein